MKTAAHIKEHTPSLNTSSLWGGEQIWEQRRVCAPACFPPAAPSSLKIIYPRPVPSLFTHVWNYSATWSVHWSLFPITTALNIHSDVISPEQTCYTEEYTGEVIYSRSHTASRNSPSTAIPYFILWKVIVFALQHIIETTVRKDHCIEVEGKGKEMEMTQNQPSWSYSVPDGFYLLSF